jgi:hypothetical protein
VKWILREILCDDDDDDETASVVKWSEFLAADAKVRVLFPGLPVFLRISGSGTEFTQPREYN